MVIKGTFQGVNLSTAAASANLRRNEIERDPRIGLKVLGFWLEGHGWGFEAVAVFDGWDQSWGRGVLFVLVVAVVSDGVEQE